MITAHDHDHGDPENSCYQTSPKNLARKTAVVSGTAMGPMGRRPCGDVEAAGCEEIPKKWILVTWINQSMVMIHYN